MESADRASYYFDDIITDRDIYLFRQCFIRQKII